MIRRQPRQRQEHHENLEYFYADGDGTFAEAVGQEPASHRESDERQREQRADSADELVAFLVG